MSGHSGASDGEIKKPDTLQVAAKVGVGDLERGVKRLRDSKQCQGHVTSHVTREIVM